MPHRIRRRPGLAGSITLVVVGALALAGCGGSSKSATNAAATTTTNGQGGGAARFTALRTCLAKNGITLPQRPAGQQRPPGATPGTGGIFGGGGGAGAGAAGPGRGFQPPAGVSQAQFQAALAKCGGVGRAPGAARRTLTPAQKATQQAALVKFAACMKTNGITLPAPNTSGTGPVFNTSKLNTTSPQFTAASKKCASLLPARFGRRGGGGPGQPGTATTTTPATTTTQ